MEEKKQYFTAKRIALTAVMSALAFGVSLLEFPIFPATPYFKLDFSFAVILLSAYMIGPLAGEIVAAISIALHLFVSSSGGVGELSNFILAQVFAVFPSVVYYFRRKLSTVLITLSVAVVLTASLALATNRYLIFPLYFGEAAGEEFLKIWGFAFAFNLIKGVANSVITVLLYKRLKNLLHKFL